jgi:hypothetical protein
MILVQSFKQWNVVYKVSNSRLGVGILKTYTKITTGEFDLRSKANKFFTIAKGH